MGILVRSGKQKGIVWSYDEDCHAALNSLVKDGGEPIGMIRVSDNGGKIAVDSQLFDEYADDPFAKMALKKICRGYGDRLIERLAQSGGVKRVKCFEDPSGWLQ